MATTRGCRDLCADLRTWVAQRLPDASRPRPTAYVRRESMLSARRRAPTTAIARELAPLREPVRQAHRAADRRASKSRRVPRWPRRSSWRRSGKVGEVLHMARVRARAVAAGRASVASLGGMSSTAPPAAAPHALFDRHLAAGAKLVDFAGWEMPVQYEGVHRGAHGGARGLRDLRRLAHGRDRNQRAGRARAAAARCSPTTSRRSPSAARSTACSAARTAACSTTSSPTASTSIAT